VDQETLIGEYDQADVFVLPSYIEGLPMVVLEAMGRGLPVIAARVGGIPEIVSDGHNGFLIEAGDVDSLVQKMETLADDKEQRLAMGRNSSQYVSRSMSLDTIAGQLAALYGE
jgi:glycosyltransferase involved in cell wall biosynthesis